MENKQATKLRRKELGLSCMLNTEVGTVLAVIRRPSDTSSSIFHVFGAAAAPADEIDPSLLQSLKSLRALIFNPHQEWRTIDPSIYLSPFLDVIQSDFVHASATRVALSAALKILKLGIFDEKTPGAREALVAVVHAITTCRLEKTDPIFEDAVMMNILQLLAGVMNHRASVLLSDQTVCTIVNTCFQVVQQSTSRGDLLQRTAKQAMHDLIHVIFSRLPEVDDVNDEGSETDNEDMDDDGCGGLDLGYGMRCAVDIFHFLCSLLNVVAVVETDGSTVHTADEDVQLFALVLINTAIDLSGDGIGMHSKLLRMMRDDLFHHLVHYGTRSSPVVFSMICSTVLNMYHFLRRHIRLQLEAFFKFVIFRVASAPGATNQLQEVALEGIINFCRQPTFVAEVYVNYDCDPLCFNVFEEIGKLLCRQTFPVSAPLSSLQIQAFEGLVIIIHNIADSIDRENDTSPSGPYPVEVTEYSPFWEDQDKENLETWVEFVRLRRAQKKKIMIAAHHYNRDEKKGMEYLRLTKLISDPPDPMAVAHFLRYTPGLDKMLIGDFLGDPDEFHIRVLRDYTETFGFAGMGLDSGLRTYLETFRLPGESQKIERILEAFSKTFYEQQPTDMFANKDTVMILCYSLIMLNTDQHNPQVKKKMTEDEFIRNNRAINGGKDLPRDYLSDLFHSISNKAIVVFGQSGLQLEMNPNRWIELMIRTLTTEPFFQCEFDRRLGRDMFACIAGPSVAALSAVFDHAEEEELLHECIEGLFSVARIAQYRLEDTLDQILATFSKFTTLLNPYASAEETLFAFSKDLKPRMATLAVFTIANNFGESIRGGWRNIVDCLLKLKKLKLLPQSALDFDAADSTTSENLMSDTNVIFPAHDAKFGGRQQSGMNHRFSHFMSLESAEDAISLGISEFEQNAKVIKQCRIGNIFSNSSKFPQEALLGLGRSFINAAAGKGQKFSTSIEEEETVGFCWDVIVAISFVNIQRLQTFWPGFHDHIIVVAQFPMFSPIPFLEKAITALFKICFKILETFQPDKLPEELIFKSINLMWKLDKEILDNHCEFVTQSLNTIMIEYAANVQTQLGWKSILHLLQVSGRHIETYDLGVETLIVFMSSGAHVSRINYAYCLDCAFSFIALKNSPLDKNIMILDLLAESVNMLVQWYRNYYSDPGNYYAIHSNSSLDEAKGIGSSCSFAMNLFVKLGEVLRKSSLARREEMRNQAVIALRKSFRIADQLDFTPANCINCFNLVVFAMVDDLHEKMLEYSRREHAERETRSMEATLNISLKLLTKVYLQFLIQITQSPGFRTFWLGVLRRMDTCMKADLGIYGESASLQKLVPDLLRQMITIMKDKGILVQKEDDDLWEITYIQIQWIAPAIKDELFPEESY